VSAWHRYFDADVRVARLRLFTTAFLLLFAFDTWTIMSWRGFAYGAAGFNVAHFAWLDAIQPLPTPASYVGLLVFVGILAAGSALVGVYRPVALLLWASFSYAWMQSLADTFQHHYFLSLLLFCLLFHPKVERRASVSTRVPGRAWAMIGTTVAILYLFTTLAKLDAVWLRGDTMRRIDLTHGNFAALEQLFAGLGVDPSTFWSVLATQVIPVEFFMSVAYVVAVATREDRGPWATAICWLGFLGALMLHGGIEFFGLEIGVFSWYMLTLACAFLLPGVVVERLCAVVRWPLDLLLDRLAPDEGGVDRVRALVLVAALLMLAAALTADLPGAAVATGLAAVSMAVAAGAFIEYGPRVRAAEIAVAGGFAAVLLMLGLGVSDARFTFYGYRGTWLTSHGDTAGAIAALEKAAAYAPDGPRGARVREALGALSEAPARAPDPRQPGGR
jgi:hypothetical protein